MAGPDDDHYWRVASRILEGYVIPFLGAGANLTERPPDTSWKLGSYLPSGTELAETLAEKSRYPTENADLLRVSQWVDAILGERVLYQYLRSLFDADYPPTSLHHLLAGLPSILRRRSTRHPLIITTNYDDALERAFVEAQEEFDLVWYEEKRGTTCGKFLHRPPGTSERIPIDVPNEYDALSLDDRTVVLKLHGAVDREDPSGDSYVITEDNYIDYLTQSDISSQIPKILREVMEESHFLFLGYSMRDWNLRVILSRIWGRQQLDIKSWSIQKAHENPKENEIERRLWSDRGDIDLIQVELREYVAGLRAQLEEVPSEAGP
jgi:hypothetical protein